MRTPMPLYFSNAGRTAAMNFSFSGVLGRFVERIRTNVDAGLHRDHHFRLQFGSAGVVDIQPDAMADPVIEPDAHLLIAGDVRDQPELQESLFEDLGGRALDRLRPAAPDWCPGRAILKAACCASQTRR